MNRTQLPLEAVLLSQSFIRRAVGVLLALILLLVMGHIVLVILWPEGNLNFLRLAVDLDREANWATWFNSTMHLCTALGAALVAWLTHSRALTPVQRRSALGWLAASAIFLYLSMDDAAQLHETFAAVLAGKIQTMSVPTWFMELRWFIWIPILGIPGVLALAALVAFLKRTLWTTPLARMLVMLGVVFFLCNPLAEAFEDRYYSLVGGPVGDHIATRLYAVDRVAYRQFQGLIVIEEMGEMLGTLAFLTAFLVYGQRLVYRSGRLTADAPELAAASEGVAYAYVTPSKE